MGGRTIPKEVAESLRDLGVRFSECQDLVAAQLVFTQAFVIQNEACGLDHPDVIACLIRLAAVYRMQGRMREAQILHNYARTLERQHLASVQTLPTSDDSSLDPANIEVL